MIFVLFQHPIDIIVEEPVAECHGFDENDAKLNFVGLDFAQTSDFKFMLNGSYEIKEDIFGPISVMYKIVYRKSYDFLFTSHNSLSSLRRYLTKVNGYLLR